MERPHWESPRTVDEAARILSESGGRARVIAGGTDLAPSISGGQVLADVLVDLGRIEELRFIDGSERSIVLGATATHGMVAADVGVKRGAELLAEACATVGSPQIRARGTIGGNLANASPAADGVVALLALDAGVVVEKAGENGPLISRELSISEFLVGPGETELGPDEIVRAVQFELPDGDSRTAYVKAGQRNALAIAIASVALVYEPGRGRIRIALGSVAPTPIRAAEAESMFAMEWQGAQGKAALVDAVASKAAEAARPIDDVRATAEYRGALTKALVRSALMRTCLS